VSTQGNLEVRRRPATPERPADPGFSDEALFLTDAPVPGQGQLAAQVRDAWVEVVQDPTRLQVLEEEWESLAAAALEPNPFYEPWMLLPALRRFGRADRVEVALVWAPHPSREKGRKLLCGLFPVGFRRGRAELWKHPYCYLSTPLLRAPVARETLALFLDWLGSRTGLARLEDVPGDGAFHLHLVDELNRRRWPSLVSSWYTRAVFRPAATGEDFLERALNGKRRKELRRQRARLCELGKLEICELRPGGDLDAWIADFITLEASGWKGRAGVAAGVRETDRAYIEEMTREAFRRGRLMMLGLRLDGRPVALKCNLLAGEGSFAFKIAFDESRARYSPGVLLELENIHRLHERPGIRWMDSCAAANRFMINHLWPERREMQTVFFSTGRTLPSLALSLLPLLNFVRARLKRRASRPRAA